MVFLKSHLEDKKEVLLKHRKDLSKKKRKLRRKETPK